ncbi:hypothetical protein [Sandaracinus amylolyticus]|uniref:Lipoprotein n=1 Tax=Sandaracinus amylolyticus TaxID=927083 RepID=A0A0F6YK99_9BACT|nr:hypothetical protein [Sandaracinus amylolyticus]AKF08632.1 Hypothetical protein DB32_005781 [Sandaracinus amylolyticus]
MNRWTRSAALFGVATMIASCGGDDASPTPTRGGYLVATRVWDDTSITSYFHVVDSLDADTQIDPSQALEVAGSARLYSYAGGWFAIGSGEAPTITRYRFGEDGSLVEDAAISLQPYGVSDLWDTVYFVSPTKAYYPDRDGSQLVVWNPTAMEVTGTIALPQTVREGYLSHYSYRALMRGDALVFSVGWFDWTNDRVLPETGLVVLDTTTDTVSRVDVDTRCGGITTPIVTESGDAYFVTAALAAAAYELERITTPPCALRVAADADELDADYHTLLADLVDGAIAGEPVRGGGQDIFLRVLDADLAEIDPVGASWDVTGQLAWRWVRWNVETNAVTPVTTLEPSTADVVWFDVDGRVFGTETTADYAETTLIELTAEGGPRRMLTAPGFLHALASVE